MFPDIFEKTGIPASKWFFDIHSRDIFFDNIPFPGTSWAFETLQRYGDVTVLSYQDTYENKRDTLEFLHREGLDTANVCFLNDKSRLDCDIMIDDNPKYFKNCKAKVCVLITAPYNKDVNLFFPRVSSDHSRRQKSAWYVVVVPLTALLNMLGCE